jgi:subtilisin family serine protease
MPCTLHPANPARPSVLRPLTWIALALSALLLAAPAQAARATPKAKDAAKAAKAAKGRTTTVATSSIDRETVAGELLLKLDTGDRLPDLMTRYQLTLSSRLGARPIFRMKVAAGADVRNVAAALSLEAGVLVAEPNYTHAGPEAAKNNVWAIGSEQGFVQQWAPEALRLAEAWQTSTGAGVRVAVLDTGVDRSHPLLASRLLPGRDFVDQDDDPSEVGTRADVAYGHGTHVAGLVALAAPSAQIMPLRVLDAQGGTDAWTLAVAMLHAVDPDGDPSTNDGAHVINLSLAGPNRTRLLDSIALLASCSVPAVADPTADLSDSGYEDDRRRCSGFGGAVVVAAAGNDGSRSVKSYPAAEGAYGLLAVAASTADRRVASFSNSGNWIQIAAPGEGITSSVPGGWGTWSGTSMAAPLVSGAAALLIGAAPQFGATDVVRCITRTASKLEGASFGQLDAHALLQAVGSRKLCR